MSNRPQETPASQLTSLETVFNFQNRAFREYMQLRSGGSNRASRLMSLSQEMSDDSHPVVVYAAGWAAAEAAINRVKAKERKFPLDLRLGALALARENWNQAIDAFKAPPRRIPSPPDLQDRLLGLRLRAQSALAQTPTMEFAARMLTGSAPDGAHLEAALAQSKSAMVELGANTLKLKLSTEKAKGIRDGFCYELLGGLLLQDYRPVQTLIVPASIRQDHHPNANLRADMLAISTDATTSHLRTLIQISSERAQPPIRSSRFIVRTEDLILQRPRETALTTLETYVDIAQGELEDPAATASLDAISHNLAQRLATFGASRS